MNTFIEANKNGYQEHVLREKNGWQNDEVSDDSYNPKIILNWLANSNNDNCVFHSSNYTKGK